MPALSSHEFQTRAAVVAPTLQEVVDYLHHDARERVCNRSFGETTVTISWEDGYLRAVKVSGGHVLRPGKTGNLPTSDSKGVDRPT